MLLTVKNTSIFLNRRESSLIWRRASQCIIQLLFQNLKANQTKFFTVQATVVDPTEKKSSQYPRTNSGQNPPLFTCQRLNVVFLVPLFKLSFLSVLTKIKEAWMLSPTSHSALHLTALPWQKESLWFLLHRSAGRKTCKLAVTSSARKWFTLHETAGKIKFTPNYPKALSLNQCVAEMIVGDVNPFSILERQGLCNELECIEQNYHILSLKYISPVVLPKRVWNWDRK